MPSESHSRVASHHVVQQAATVTQSERVITARQRSPFDLYADRKLGCLRPRKVVSTILELHRSCERTRTLDRCTDRPVASRPFSKSSRRKRCECDMLPVIQTDLSYNLIGFNSRLPCRETPRPCFSFPSLAWHLLGSA